MLSLLKFKYLFAILLTFAINTTAIAQEKNLDSEINKQIISAANCEQLAYGIELKNLEADEVFKDCVERRALMIAMQRKYGIGKYGKVDAFDKIEAYSYLLESTNKMVQKEASSYSTAAGE